jgi:hypothetical protein
MAGKWFLLSADVLKNIEEIVETLERRARGKAARRAKHLRAWRRIRSIPDGLAPLAAMHDGLKLYGQTPGPLRLYRGVL